MSKKFELVVENQNEEMSLSFSVRNNITAERWFESLKNAATQSTIYEADRWYNFKDSKYSSFEKLTKDLELCIAELNTLEPGLIDYQFDHNNIQKSVNDLHVHFADSHLIASRITEKSYDAWHKFNDLLHAFETLERSKTVETETGQTNAAIILTFHEHFKQELIDDDYEQFTIAKKFGTVYVNYCQVGRHIFELFNAQDEIAEDEHILPLKNLSADSYFWFGPSSGKSGIERKWTAIGAWFKAHESRFNKMGFHWGDPRLAIGWIPVADLTTPIESKVEQIKFVDNLSQFSRVKKVLTN